MEDLNPYVSRKVKVSLNKNFDYPDVYVDIGLVDRISGYHTIIEKCLINSTEKLHPNEYEITAPLQGGTNFLFIKVHDVQTDHHDPKIFLNNPYITHDLDNDPDTSFEAIWNHVEKNGVYIQANPKYSMGWQDCWFEPGSTSYIFLDFVQMQFLTRDFNNTPQTVIEFPFNISQRKEDNKFVVDGVESDDYEITGERFVSFENSKHQHFNVAQFTLVRGFDQ